MCRVCCRGSTDEKGLLGKADMSSYRGEGEFPSVLRAGIICKRAKS